MNTTIRQLLDTADLLIDGNGGPTTAGAVPGGPAIAVAGGAVPAPPTTALRCGPTRHDLGAQSR